MSSSLMSRRKATHLRETVLEVKEHRAAANERFKIAVPFRGRADNSSNCVRSCALPPTHFRERLRLND
jgi:hypothetical protein